MILLLTDVYLQLKDYFQDVWEELMKEGQQKIHKNSVSTNRQYAGWQNSGRVVSALCPILGDPFSDFQREGKSKGKREERNGKRARKRKRKKTSC